MTLLTHLEQLIDNLQRQIRERDVTIESLKKQIETYKKEKNT